MPKFDKSKRYQDKNGRKFGEGVWLDDSGNPIMLGQGRYDKESNTVKQYNSDGTVTTFTRQDWVKKQQKDHEMRVLQNDRKYAAPYLPEKAMTIHTNVDGKAGRIDLSENQLDSIAVNAKRAGLPFQTALGISYKESTLGQHQERKAGTALTPWLKTISNPFDKSDSRAQQAREVSYTGVQSPTLVISNWKQKLESPYAEYIYDSKLIPRDSKQSKEGPRTEQYYDENFLSSLYWGNRYKLKDENPLEHGFREYKKDPSRWNPGETGYEEDVKAKGRQLMQSLEIQEYVKRKNVKSEGGFLQPKDAWDALSMREMADMMKVAVRNGITDLKTIREKYNEFANGGHLYDGTAEKSQKMDRGGYVPSDAIRKRIEQYEGKAMTGAIDPLSGRYARNNSFESEAGRFYSVLPESIRERVLSNPELADNLYSYSYNVGAGNFKSRVVPVLEKYYAGEAGAADVASSMWASGDRKLRGLQKRRAEERNGVLGALQGGQGTGISQAAVSEQPAFMPYDLGELFPAMPASDAVQMPSEAELRRQQRDAERLERRNRLQGMMDILDMVYGRSSDNPLVSNGLLGPLGALMYGGGGHLFDGQSEPTQQMNIMAYHPDEDYYTGPASKLPEVTVTGKAPSWFGKKGLYPTGPRYKSGQWVSAKTPQLTAGEAMKGIDAASGPLLHWMQPSQYVGAVRDAANGENPLVSMLRGNSGVVSEEYAQEHPWLSTAFNFATDIAVPAGIMSKSKISRPQVFQEGTPAAEWAEAANQQGNVTDNLLKWLERPSGYKPERSVKERLESLPSSYRKMANMFEESGIDLSRIGVKDLQKARKFRMRDIEDSAPQRYTLAMPTDEGYNLTDILNKDEVGLIELSLGKDKNTAVEMVSNLTHNPITKEQPVHGVYERGLNAAINTAQSEGGRGVVSGRLLVSAPRQYPVIQRFKGRELLGRDGTHTNINVVPNYDAGVGGVGDAESMLELRRAGSKEAKSLSNAPYWLLPNTTEHIPTKSVLFNPSIIDRFGKMHINWDDPNIFKGIAYPTLIGSSLYGLKNE